MKSLIAEYAIPANASAIAFELLETNPMPGDLIIAGHEFWLIESVDRLTPKNKNAAWIIAGEFGMSVDELMRCVDPHPAWKKAWTVNVCKVRLILTGEKEVGFKDDGYAIFAPSGMWMESLSCWTKNKADAHCFSCIDDALKVMMAILYFEPPFNPVIKQVCKSIP